jgi:flagellar hook-associated protein FlgK
MLYRGNGVQAKLVGEIDAVKNGQAGQPLRVNLTTAFQNGDFESSTAGAVQVDGWQVVNQRVRLGGTDTLAGYPTPTDTQAAPNGSGETASVSVGTSYATQVIDTGLPDNGLALRLNSDNASIDPYGVLHGPYVVSESAVSIQAGGSVSFDWKAQGGSDNFDVYAYLLNEDTGQTIELLNQTGGTTAWATETKTVNTAGSYKFVFISGTYDASGGQAAGAQLYIDNVTVQSTVPSFAPTESDLNNIKSLVNYSNSGSYSQLQRNTNALGLNSGVITGQVRLERTDGTLKTIGLSIADEGSAADLQRLGFRAAAHIDGPAADDLLVFVSGAGAAQIAASYTTEALDAKEKLRNNPMTLKFVTATRFTLTDQKTGTLLAERDFDGSLPDASISFQGLNVTFSKPPQLGDSFVLDGNRDGTGNNENMLEIVALEAKPVMGNGKTLGSAYIDHVNDMGNISRQASIVQSALTVVHDQAVASRDSVSGVSLDEEATNLIRFQQAYQASAKVMQVASQLFDSVLQIR